MADVISAFTPVNLLTGFLGSGKTTLLRRLLEDPALSDTAVLINEFGEIGLDHHLVERIDETMVLLRSGCLCCTMRGELASAIRDLHSRRERGSIPAYRRLVIESSGLADPFPILSTLKADPVLRHHVHAGMVITTVDAVNGLAQSASHPESVRQVAVADRLVLTKTDLVEDVTRLEGPDEVGSILIAPMIDARLGIDAGALLGDARTMSDFLAATSEDPAAHAGRIRSFVVTVAEPIDWTAFGVWLSMLLNRHGDRRAAGQGHSEPRGRAGAGGDPRRALSRA